MLISRGLQKNNGQKITISNAPCRIVNCEGKRMALSYEFSAKKRCAKIAGLRQTYQAYKAAPF
ncbi:MAG: hypothetical protein JNN25_09070 [Candidatus Kapabacteria bacterium]|nr:hypothetical protein [Candidatus Kapabacteria bacterium]